MKTLIEKFTETVRLTATNFCLTDGLNRDGIDSISFTQHKRGLARYIYGKSCCLGGLTKSSNPKLYAIATDEIVYIINRTNANVMLGGICYIRHFPMTLLSLQIFLLASRIVLIIYVDLLI